jgi:hypothetical protein
MAPVPRQDGQRRSRQKARERLRNRAQLIGLLEQPRSATLENGSAGCRTGCGRPLTGLRHAGREVSRDKNAEGGSIRSPLLRALTAINCGECHVCAVVRVPTGPIYSPRSCRWLLSTRALPQTPARAGRLSAKRMRGGSARVRAIGLMQRKRVSRAWRTTFPTVLSSKKRNRLGLAV